MAEIDDLLASLTSALGTLTPGYSLHSAANDIYEGYLWSEIIRVAAAQSPPWSIHFANAGASGQAFLFRTAPGVIYSQVPYSYAILARSGKILEVHLGIKVLGISGVAHEFDILVVQKSEADLARAEHRHPSFIAVAMHLEGKFYSNDLSLGIARGLVGLGTDCSVRAHLASRGSGPASIRTLLKHYRSTYVHNVLPSSTGPAYLQTCIEWALDHA